MEEKETHATHGHAAKKAQNPWVYSTIALLIIAIVASGIAVTNPAPQPAAGDTATGAAGLAPSAEAMDATQVEEKVLDYVNNVVLLGSGATATATGTEEEGPFYKCNLEIGNGQMTQEAAVYATKDGTQLFLSAPVDLTTPPAPAFAKSDKPKVELFVMSHCPFGTQTEKGAIPVAELLGDQIDFEIKFVDYAMHGEKEITEQLRQHCIQSEQNERYLPYLKCFLEDGDSARCIKETGVDASALEACQAIADEEYGVSANFSDQSKWLNGRYPVFPIHQAENDAYGVQGSPTLVINGETTNTGRDSQSILSTVCARFTDPPAQCDTTLSSATPSTGFGYAASTQGSVAAGQCG